MKKNKKIYIYIILVLLIILSASLLGYNSFVNLSYVRKKQNEYTFMLPKEIEYISQTNSGIFINEKILSSSVVLFTGVYELAKESIQTYKFYNSNVEKISDYEEKINDKNLYVITKKITYFDNNKTTYMFDYIYEINDDKQFVISVECKNLKDINYLMKKLKRTATSVILY